MIIALKGGPKDGQQIDTGKICNCSDEYCPVHGIGFNHRAGMKPSCVRWEWLEQHSYDVHTGEYLGKKTVNGEE